MAWTDERIDTLKAMWESGMTASQIAEKLGGVSRNAVIGKAHRLGLQSRPSPVKANDAEEKPQPKAKPAPAPAPSPTPKAAEPKPAPVARPAAPTPSPAPAAAAAEAESDDPPEGDAPKVVLRSVGPGGFIRQSPGEQQSPVPPAPPRRLVPARPSPEVADKTSLLDLNDRICKWPIGHPGEPDFHFCGAPVNPGFPYCVEHCGHAYQAQLPRRDRRPPPPMPFGGPRGR
ncbi:MAG: GcrA family cell cycle regulator [Sphingomonas sp.]